MRDDWSTLRKLMFQRIAAGGRLIEDTVTGNPAVFETNVAKPLSGFTIPFYPVQTGSGDPSPQNQCPIIGWQGLTAWRTGVNLLDPAKKTTPSTHIYFYKENGIYLPAGKYTLSCSKKVAGLFVHTMDNTLIVTGYNNTAKSFTLSEGQTVYINFYDTNIDTTMDCQLEVCETPSTYAEYTGESYPVTFPALGKNLLPPTVYNYIVNSGTVNGNSNGRSMYARIKPGTYTIKRDVISGNRFRGYVSVDEPKSGVKLTQVFNDDDALTRTITVGEGYNYLFVYLANDGSEITSNIMLNEGSAIPYEPYTNTVYGGTVYPLDGKMLVEWAFANLNSESAWGSYGTGYGFLVYVTKSDMQVGNRLSGYCDMFPSTFSQTGANIRFGADDNVIRIYNINTLGITDLSEWKEFIGTDGINVCYPLATPYEIPLSDIPVPVTLIGDNTIWTDTNGSNTIKYKKKG